MMKGEDLLSRKIVSAAIEVYRNPGPVLPEAVYEECLYREFRERNIACDRQVKLPVRYKGARLDCGYRLDVVVDRLVILESKAVNKLEPICQAQLLTYLRLSGIRLGFLLNFNVLLKKDGIRRVVNNL
jgi:GxxExxY protein